MIWFTGRLALRKCVSVPSRTLFGHLSQPAPVAVGVAVGTAVVGSSQLLCAWSGLPQIFQCSSLQGTGDPRNNTVLPGNHEMIAVMLLVMYVTGFPSQDWSPVAPWSFVEPLPKVPHPAALFAGFKKAPP